MTPVKCDTPEKLALLRKEDHFRSWQSLDDKRVCVLCEETFAGQDVIVSRHGAGYELHCPTRGCPSRVHQWVYPGNPLSKEAANADWWQALADPLGKEAHAI